MGRKPVIPQIHKPFHVILVSFQLSLEPVTFDTMSKVFLAELMTSAQYRSRTVKVNIFTTKTVCYSYGFVNTFSSQLANKQPQIGERFSFQSMASEWLYGEQEWSWPFHDHNLPCFFTEPKEFTKENMC